MTKPQDKVQLIKQESSAGGGDSADSGEEFNINLPLDPMEDAPEVQGFFIQDTVGPSDEDVYITRNGDDMIFRDNTVGTEVTLNDLTAAGSAGISQPQHESLRQLVHFLEEGPAQGFASGAYKEVIGGVFPTQVIWWESAAKTQKIVEKEISYMLGYAKPTPITWTVYETDGVTVSGTVIDSITYDGITEVNRTRTIS